jgi:hypothetical protein
MKMPFLNKRILLLILFVLALQGCTTLADARKAEGEGVRKVYKADVETTWKKTLQVLGKLNLDVATENKQEGYILAQRGMGVFQMSYGENIAIFLKPKTTAETEVEVVSKKVMATNIFAPDWSEDIHKQLKLAFSN